MKNYYEIFLKKIILEKKMVELRFYDESDFRTCFVLNANVDFLTFVEVNSGGQYSGVLIYKQNAIKTIKVDTIYLSELIKNVDVDDIYRVVEALELQGNFSFDNFLSNASKNKRMIEITFNNEDYLSGIVVDFNDSHVLIDEYYAENDRRFARSMISKADIVSLAVDLNWLKTVERSLKDKNIDY